MPVRGRRSILGGKRGRRRGGANPNAGRPPVNKGLTSCQNQTNLLSHFGVGASTSASNIDIDNASANVDDVSADDSNSASDSMDSNNDNSDNDEESSNIEEVISIQTCAMYLYDFNNNKKLL